MRLNKIIIFSFSMLCCFCCFAQAKKRPKKSDEPEKKVITVKIGKPIKLPNGKIHQETMEIDITNELQEQMVEDNVKKLAKLIKKENDKEIDPETEKRYTISSAEIAFFSRRMLYFSYHPQIEDVTEIYKDWYRDLSKNLTVMYKIKNQFYLIQNRNDPKKRAELAKMYKPYFNKVIGLLSKPKKIPRLELKKKREALSKKLSRK